MKLCTGTDDNLTIDSKLKTYVLNYEHDCHVALLRLYHTQLKGSETVWPEIMHKKIITSKSCPYACHEGIWGSKGTAPHILGTSGMLHWVNC